MGVIELPERVFGLESAGVVVRVGADVKGVEVGDRVACIENRAFATSIITTQEFFSKIPEELNFIEAATMIIPYTTVIHSLITVGGVTKDTVRGKLSSDNRNTNLACSLYSSTVHWRFRPSSDSNFKNARC